MNNIEVSAFLADSAETVQGKIYAHGIGWNFILAEKFPAVHARVAVGMVITVPYTSTNQNHKATISLLTEDAKKIVLQRVQTPAGEIEEQTQIIAEFNMGRPPLLPAGDAQVLSFAVNFNQLVLEKPGMYIWEIEVDGTPMAKIHMRANQVLPSQRMQ